MEMDFANDCPLVRPALPRIRFLFVGSQLCSTLPSDNPSRFCPCASLVLHLHQVAQGTFTPKLLGMPSTHGWVLAMLVPPAEAGGPARGCAPVALSRGAVAPLCAPWCSGGVGARSAPTSRRARSPRGVEQGAAFWCARVKNVCVRLAARSLCVILTNQGPST